MTLFATADFSVLSRRWRHDRGYEHKRAIESHVPYLIRVLAGALRLHPQFNGWVKETELIICDDVNIAIAVQAERALLTSVLHEVQDLPPAVAA